MDSDKIIDIISGIEFNIKELPLVVGSLSKYDKLNKIIILIISIIFNPN